MKKCGPASKSGSICTGERTRTQPRKVGSIGIPLPLTDSKVVDEEDNEVRSGVVGELIIKGPQVMKGYWRKPEETKAILKDG